MYCITYISKQIERVKNIVHRIPNICKYFYLSLIWIQFQKELEEDLFVGDVDSYERETVIKHRKLFNATDICVSRTCGEMSQQIIFFCDDIFCYLYVVYKPVYTRICFIQYI